MSKEKQIDEMARIIDDNHGFIVSSLETAEALYEKGYRKASEVAREIIDILKSVGIDEWRYPVIAEIKKMYLEG